MNIIQRFKLILLIMLDQFCQNPLELPISDLNLAISLWVIKGQKSMGNPILF